MGSGDQNAPGRSAQKTRASSTRVEPNRTDSSGRLRLELGEEHAPTIQFEVPAHAAYHDLTLETLAAGCQALFAIVVPTADQQEDASAVTSYQATVTELLDAVHQAYWEVLSDEPRSDQRLSVSLLSGRAALRVELHCDSAQQETNGTGATAAGQWHAAPKHHLRQLVDRVELWPDKSNRLALTKYF